jgi:transcriptional regulator of acetoin/glycerol metabolism
MRDRWAGLEAGVDAGKFAALLRRAHEASLRSGRTSKLVRGVIADSWDRCKEAGVDAGSPGAPRLLDEGDASDRWSEHPLSRATEVLRTALGDLLYDARHIVVVSDADGCILWSDGHPDVLRASERIRFTPGHAWSEKAAGTNAVGTALAADHALQVFSAEHYREEVHPWQCSAAPVHDPETGETLGAIDVTGSFRTAHPHTLAMVQLAAHLVEQQLRREMLERDNRILGLFAEHTARFGGPAAAISPGGRVLASTPVAWTGGRVEVPTDGIVAQPLGEGLLLVPESTEARARRGPAMRLSMKRRGRVRIELEGGAVRTLSARHSEIVGLLAEHPDGLDSHELAELVYGEPGHEVSLRAEMHRLRESLGSVLATRPYRLHEVDLAGIGVEQGTPSGQE